MRYNINLFPQKEKGFAEKFIYFTFHYLRYILVLTQLVVIGVFFYRFKVDQEIIELKETLKQKQEIVKISKPLISEAGVVEKKISNISVILKSQDSYTEMYTYFLSIFPQDFYLTKMDIASNSIVIEGITLDVNVMKKFYQRLQQDKKFTLVKLNRLERKEEGYEFQMQLDKYVKK